MSRRAPVITGTGIICAAGSGVTAVWKSVRANRSGLGPLTLFSSQRYANHLVGQVHDNVDELAGNLRGSRSDKLSWIAAREALEVAGLAPVFGKINPARIGVMLGSTVGGMLGTEKVLSALLRENKHRFAPLRFHECASTADLCAKQIGALGPVATLSTACSAGAMAILAAAELIEQGEADIMLAGAGDSLSRLTLNGFGSLLLLDPNGCRPFDARRTGISLGEGAAMLVIEAEETALARGAKILARLAGWGASCDAFHATAPQPDGKGAFAAMQRALERGGLQPNEIDFISAHGTATPDNDAMETRALKNMFGDAIPPFASVKRFFGHTLAASGAIKAVLAVQSLHEQAIPGTPGFEVADEKLGLEPVKEFRAQPVSRILSNSFGFGGNNVSLVFETSDSDRSPQAQAPANAKGFAILGAGVASAAGNSFAEIAAGFGKGGHQSSQFPVPAISPTAQAKVYACSEFGADQFIEPAKRRKLSRIQQMTLVAAKKALGAELIGATAPEKICAVIGTGLGSLTDTAAFVENLILKDGRTDAEVAAEREAARQKQALQDKAAAPLPTGTGDLKTPDMFDKTASDTALFSGQPDPFEALPGDRPSRPLKPGESSLGAASSTAMAAGDETSGERPNVTNATTAQIREETGLPPKAGHEVRTWAEVVQPAAEEILQADSQAGYKLVQRVLNATDPRDRMLTDTETMVLNIHQDMLLRERNAAAAATHSGSPADKLAAQQKVVALQTELSDMLTAVEAAGTPTAQALNIRKAIREKDSWELQRTAPEVAAAMQREM